MNVQEDRGQRGQTVLDPVLIERMKALVASRTRESLHDRFGISYNTWRKLIAGDPVRSSLAIRLQERIRRIDTIETPE
jgi:hypothetical protein